MTGMVSEVNANRGLASTASSKPESMTQTSTQETKGPSGESRGFSGGGSGTGGSSSMSSGSRTSGMTGTSMNSGKDKDDKISSGFSGGRSY
jgi:hypothetical protein